MSKGSKPRPMSVSYNKYVDNWEKAFGNKTEECDYTCGGCDEIEEDKEPKPEKVTAEIISTSVPNFQKHGLLKDNSLDMEIEMKLKI